MMERWRLFALRMPLEHSPEDLERAICKKLQLPSTALRSHRIVKRSVDARQRGGIALVYALDLELELTPAGQARLRRRFAKGSQLRPTPDDTYRFVREHPLEALTERPLVIGAGPCGYFAALLLAQMGCRPLLLERGQPVKRRTADTFGFWRGERAFDAESNAQFGEGGAGTFSDGKLYSQISEPPVYARKVLEELVAAGANPEILTLHRPHIGTFRLATVVRGLRAKIEALGGEVRFGARVDGLVLAEDGSRQVRGVRLSTGEGLRASQVVLAVGHSARDTFSWLEREGVAMECKPFAVGLRIEHPQGLIDRARWGDWAGHPALGSAEYKLVHHTAAGRDVYSFCMCPGGWVVAATSEAGCVATNGMSQHSRRERNANSGLVVNITSQDLEPWGRWPGDPLAGVAFQRHWERRAFEAGGGNYRAPAQTLANFLSREAPASPQPRVNDQGDDSGAETNVQASYLPGVAMTSLEGCLPDFVLSSIREALPFFARSLPGYLLDGALLTGVETRTSSPLRIRRLVGSLQSENTPGLYPAGEGAGYAGGILSAAIDGVKVAEAVARALTVNPPLPHLPGAPGESACDPA
ncbi:MAG: FAD-dependent oxidoreductase [Cyanobacteriota bacterium]|nr:FAD-dependent oxidoreductase [Cyanobacteriota bacterium]